MYVCTEVQTSKLFLHFTVYALIKRKIIANSDLFGKPKQKAFYDNYTYVCLGGKNVLF